VRYPVDSYAPFFSLSHDHCFRRPFFGPKHNVSTGILAGDLNPIAEILLNRLQQYRTALPVPLAQTAKVPLIESILDEFCQGLLLQRGGVQVG
jgi:hypothetical protein